MDQSKHRRWVKRGYCPVIHRHKIFCDKEAGHLGKHRSKRVEKEPGLHGRTYVVDVYWSDSERMR